MFYIYLGTTLTISILYVGNTFTALEITIGHVIHLLFLKLLSLLSTFTQLTIIKHFLTEAVHM